MSESTILRQRARSNYLYAQKLIRERADTEFLYKACRAFKEANEMYYLAKKRGLPSKFAASLFRLQHDTQARLDAAEKEWLKLLECGAVLY